jgi:hypothetical protein
MAKAKAPWTSFFNALCYKKGHSPFDYIIIQTTRGRAEDVMRNGFGEDPHEINCEQHESGWSISDMGTEFPMFLLDNSNVSLMIVRQDAVPFYEQGIWVHRTAQK